MAVRTWPMRLAALTLWPWTSPMTAAASPVPQADEIVKVPADVHAVAGGKVPGGHSQAGHTRQGAGQQAGLQALGELVLGILLSCPVQGLDDQGADGGEGGALGQGEVAGPGVADDADVNELSRDHQRQPRPRAHAVVDVSAFGEGGAQFLPVGEEGRHPVGQLPRGRVGGQSRDGDTGGEGVTVDEADELRGKAAVADDPGPARLGDQQPEGLGLQGEQEVVSHLVHHFVDGGGFGQGAGEMHQMVERVHSGGAGHGVGADGARLFRAPDAVGTGDAHAHAGAVRIELEQQMPAAGVLFGV